MGKAVNFSLKSRDVILWTTPMCGVFHKLWIFVVIVFQFLKMSSLHVDRENQSATTRMQNAHSEYIIITIYALYITYTCALGLIAEVTVKTSLVVIEKSPCV